MKKVAFCLAFVLMVSFLFTACRGAGEETVCKRGFASGGEGLSFAAGEVRRRVLSQRGAG